MSPIASRSDAEVRAAIQDCRLVLANPGPHMSDAARATIWSEIARLYDRRGDRAEATAAIATSLKFNPDDPGALRLRASARRDAGDLAGALSDDERLVSLKPNEPAALVDRARTYVAMGQWSRGLGELNRIVALAPDDAVARAARGSLLDDLGRGPEAVADLTAAVQLKPSPQTYGLRAVAYANTGDFDAAFADLDRADLLQPGDLDAVVIRCAILAMSPRTVEARAQCDRAAALEPDAPILPARARIEFHEKHYARALTLANKAFALQPRDVDVLTIRSQIKSAAGDAKGAAADRAMIERLRRQ